MGLPVLRAMDQALYEVVDGPAPVTIAEVIARMEAIDALLPVEGDGLKWFNLLYLMVTTQVDVHAPGGGWKSPVWLTLLDVVFAGRYFAAVRDLLTGSSLPSAWGAVFAERHEAGIDRIQFALAGMNAHINHDLALALVETDAELGMDPVKDGPEYADYECVNGLLDGLIPAALTMLAADVLGVLAQDTGKVGRLLAFWDLCRARELAWEFADHLKGLDGLRREVALNGQDALTGVIGRALLAFR